MFASGDEKQGTEDESRLKYLRVMCASTLVNDSRHENVLSTGCFTKD